MTGPLTGIQVLELIQKGPGAYVTMMLADMGAEVIKIETPSHAPESGSGGSAGSNDRRARLANIANRGKYSLVLDLKRAEGREIMRRLAGTADVLVEGFRPGVTSRLGADYAALGALNHRLIYCSLSGYGQTGPYRDLPGHDINFLAMAGVLNLIGARGGPPLVPPNLIADFGGAGLHAVCGIVMALFARERTGRGQLVDISYLDCTLSLLSPTRAMREYLANERLPERGVGALSGQFAYYRVYATQDGKYITIGCVEPWLWRNFCGALERPDLEDAGPTPADFRGEESERQAWCRGELEELFKTRTRDAWFDLLSRNNVCVGKVQDMADVFSDPQLQQREMVCSLSDSDAGEIGQVGIAIKLSDTPGEVRGAAPWKGQHSGVVLAKLGYSEAQIAQLRVSGVI